MQPELAILVFGFYLTIGVGLVIWAFLFSGFVTQELFADFQELFAEIQELFEKTCVILRGVSEGNMMMS
jgi:flagellar biosynthesis protein FliR